MLYANGMEFLGFQFLFSGGTVTVDNPAGQMAISQDGKPQPVLFNAQRPYTLHTSVLGSRIWSNLRLAPVAGSITVWASKTPQL